MPDLSLIPHIDEIVALDAKPKVRNLQITQCYADLSAALGAALGRDDANWCTYATWASKQAGVFIRREEVPALFRGLLTPTREFTKRVAKMVDGVGTVDHGAVENKRLSLVGIVDETVERVSAEITGGNLKVFSELAPVFARFAEAFADGQPDAAKLKAICDDLSDGRSDRGGQSTLKSALEHYHRALEEPGKRSQWMLLANLEVGLHEQIRLQPAIAGALRAPVEEMRESLHELIEIIVPGETLDAVVIAMSERAMRPFLAVFTERWLELATELLMTLEVDGETLRLGRKLPPPASDGAMFPADLKVAKLEIADLCQLLEQFGALHDGPDDDGAEDWTDLAERMHYIADLFRSRQHVDGLWNPPFEAGQRAQIAAGHMPQGTL